MVENNDEATQFYTGLPSWSMFQYLVHFISKDIPQSKHSKLSLVDGLLLTLMRLRLNLKVNDLAYCFDVSNSKIGRVFSNWIEDLFVNLKCLIKWPSQEMVCQNSPSIFKDLYPDTQCIIDCTEIFIECPYGYVARAQMYCIILLSF